MRRRRLDLPRTRLLASVLASALSIGVVAPRDAPALVFASPESEPRETLPPDFPYWENVTQRRYESPSVVYLGNGFALTARHVGMGEIFLRGEIVPPIAGSNRTLINRNGSAADAMLFRVALPDDFADLPLIPIAREGPRLGEEVLLIGYGRVRANVIAVETAEDGEVFGFGWSTKGEKRWGTNRVARVGETLYQDTWTTHSVGLAFDPPGSPDVTPFEAQATVGDSGGAVFVRRDGEWLLAGMMTSVTGYTRAPARTSMYGDITYAADLAQYREEIMRFARPACANELDDDGDHAIDHPADGACDSPLDRSERDSTTSALAPWWLAIAAIAGIAGMIVAIRTRLRPPA